MFYGSFGYWTSLLVPLAAFFALLIVFRRRALENADLVKVRSNKANKIATKRLKKAHLLMLVGKQEEFYTPLFHEFLKGADEFIDDFVFAFTDVVDDAGLDMLAQEFLIERIQCRLDGTDLSQDINTVAVVFDHLSHTPYLALDAVQAGNEQIGRAHV